MLAQYVVYSARLSCFCLHKVWMFTTKRLWCLHLTKIVILLGTKIRFSANHKSQAKASKICCKTFWLVLMVTTFCWHKTLDITLVWGICFEHLDCCANCVFVRQFCGKISAKFAGKIPFFGDTWWFFVRLFSLQKISLLGMLCNTVTTNWPSTFRCVTHNSC